MGNETDFNGDGLVDMRMDEVATANQELRAATDKLAGQWEVIKTEIVAHLSKLGRGGKMSDQFMLGYNDRDSQLRHGDGDNGIEGAKGYIAGYQRFPDQVDAAVQVYREGERTAIEQFYGGGT